MLKKYLIITSSLFAFMQLSFAEVITYVENTTKKSIEFKSNVFHSNGAERLPIKIQSGSRVHLEVETRLKNNKAGKIFDTSAPWWVQIDGKDFYVNWVGANIQTVIMNDKEYQKVGSSNSKGKGYTAIFKNLKVTKNHGHGDFEGTVDLEFIPNKY